jgi:hypothetical protein
VLLDDVVVEVDVVVTVVTLGVVLVTADEVVGTEWTVDVEGTGSVTVLLAWRLELVDFELCVIA